MFGGGLDDPLDAPDFDAISFINHHFPSEASLNNLDTFVISIGSKIGVLDDEISKAVQAQSCAGEQASKVRPCRAGKMKFSKRPEFVLFSLHTHSKIMFIYIINRTLGTHSVRYRICLRRYMISNRKHPNPSAWCKRYVPI